LRALHLGVEQLTHSLFSMRFDFEHAFINRTVVQASQGERRRLFPCLVTQQLGPGACNQTVQKKYDVCGKMNISVDVADKKGRQQKPWHVAQESRGYLPISAASRVLCQEEIVPLP